MRNLFSSAKKSSYLSSFILAISMILLTIPGYGQLLQWNTFGNLGTETTEPSVFNATGIAAADLTHGTGVDPAANSNRFGGDHWFDTGNTNPTTLSESIADDDYIEFVVTPSSGYVYTPTAFVFNWERSGTGPESVTLRSSNDGFTADLGSVTGLPSSLSTGNSIPISGLTNLAVVTTFRLYGYGATGTTGSGGFDGTSSIVNVELSGTSSCIVRNINTSVTYCSLQDAIDNAFAGHGLELLADITEGLVQVTEEVTIDGNGFVLTSTSGTYGIEVSSENVTISDLTIENAGSFGVHANCNSHTLSLTNVTVDNSGGSGVTINGSDNVVITNLTSTNNGGNGLSATNCDNMSVNGITTIGNSFGGGFEAGIGLFTTTAYCSPPGINGFSLTGSVSIDEDTKMYSEKESASDVITGISGSSVSWAVGVGALVRSYWPDKATAYAVVDVSFEPPFNYPNTAIYVAEIATEDFYVDDNPAGDASPPMLIQTSINLQAPGGTVIVEPGTYTENLVVNKALTLHGANVDVDCSSGRGAESIITTSTGSGSQAISVTADGVTINGFTISNPGGSYGVYTQGRNNLEVLYNIITDIGNNTSGSNASYGIAISMGSAADMDNVLLDNNCINNIRGGENTSLSGPAAKANNGSAAGIGVGFSTAEYNITNLTVTNNLIDNITACTDDFSDGGKGAYGVLINVGANSAAQYDGQAVSPLVQNNEIDMLAGHWSHGIGLEGETPGAQVKNNIVSNLTDTKGNTDALGVMIEDNIGVATVEINENSFTNMAFAIRNTEATTVDAECNWYGTAVAMDVAALIDGPADYISWLTDGTDDQPGIRGFQHPAGCDGAPVILTSAVPSPETCAGGDGSIEVTFSGGTSPFDVSWTGPSSGSDIGVTSPHTITPLSAGIYTVTVTDDNGSTATATATIEYSPVYNSTALTYHTTIQDAITSASPGDVIEVCAGSYTEALTINLSLTLQGPNTGIPGTGIRISEAILEDGSINVTGSGTVVIDGFYVHQTNTTSDVILLSGGSVTTVENCILEREGTTTGDIVRAITTSSGAGIKTIQNNFFTGDDSGGLFSGHKTWNSGMYVNGAASTVNILNNSFENCRTALNLDDFNNGITLSGNTLDNCGTFLAFGGTSPTNGQHVLGANDFNTPGSAFVNCANVDPAFRLDITSSTLGGAVFNTYPLATLFLVEQGMYHRGRSGRNGLVYCVANNQYVVSGQTTIQSAVDYGAVGDVINLDTDTYNERVTLSKELTLDGAGAGLTILDGTGLPGNGNGITINNGIENVTIQDLTVRDYTGTNPNSNAGIYGVGGNNNLTVMHVDLADNIGGSGFYANGPVDNVLLDYVDAHGHTNVNGAARGIVIWNGHKSNITITNCEVYNNNCCGIELQDGSSSGVNISDNNVHDNWDNGIGIVGMDGSTGANLVGGNAVYNNGRFGIEIKNPNGDGSNIVVSNNDVQQTSSFVGQRPSEVRDIAGIAVFRRGLTGSNVDVPTGVTVSGNSVTGYIQDNGASVSEGFGIVIEGTFHTVTGNTLTSNDIGIQQQAGHLPYPGDGDQSNLADNYFGRGNSPTTCGNAFSSNIFSTNGVDERSVGTVGGLVTNTTTLEIFCTIQEGVDDPQTLDGHTLAIAAGTYNERVTLSKELILDGAGAGLTILDGTGLPGNGNGITINNGIENVTIQDLTVRDYTGTNPNSNAGIYGVGGNNNLTVMHVDLADNIGGSGFYANGPVDNVLLDYVDAHGHTNVNGAARGIVIWNGHKSNITITNCEVYNNNCCGIELQDGSSSGVNISNNNVYDNWDNGIGLVGMDETTGANLVNMNTVTDNGRFGIEIKNPNGGGTNTVVSNNMVSQSNSFATLRPSELRDIAGIAVFRRGLTGSNVDVPTGVQVTGNMVTGYIQDNGASFSEGFGIVIEGTNHTVTGNTLTSNDIGIQQQAGHLPYPGDGNQNNLADNYFGRGNSPMTCSNDVSSNTFVTNGTDTRNVSTGGGFVTNTTTLEVFCSIQSAIDDASTVNGHTLAIDPGTYNETVVINKELTLTGSGNSSNPLTSTVLVAPVSCTGNAFTISANNVTIQNMYATDYNNGAVLNGVSNATLDQMTLEDYCLYGVSLAGSLNTNVVVTSTVIQRTSYLAGTVGLRAGTANGVNGLLIDECTINGNEFGIYTAQSSATPSLFTDITIQASTISNNLKKGFYFEKLDDALLQELTMDNNGTDATYGFNNGIDINLKYDDYSGITISNCDITNSGVFGTAPDPESPAVITVKARDDAPSYSGNPASLTNVTIQNCLITGPENGIRFGEFGKVNGGPANVTVEGNDLSFAFANKALIRRTNDNVNVVCNWHGSTSLPVILSTFADAGAGSTILTSILTSGGDSSGDVGFQPSGSCGCASGNLVTNTNTSETFCTIQAAIDDADTDPGHVLEVGPGTYIEYLYIDKPLDLRGNNFGIDPNTNVRVAESIIIPSYSDPDYTTGGSILYIGSAASGSSVDGFTLDGDNPDLTSAMDINGANIDAVSAVAMYEGAGDLSISNNIAKNVSYSGIELASYPLSLPISTDNVISNNLIDNVGGSPFGIGVIVHYNAYTQIENNVITQVRVGVQTGNFTKVNTGAAATISNNDVTSSRRSIFYNVMYNGSSPFTIEDNTLEAEIGSLNSWGLTLGTLGTGVTANILNNTITGHQVGVDFWNNLATTPITVQGGTISNCQVGARANNYDGYNSNAGSASVAMSGVTISACDTAVWVKDNPLNSNGATITLTIKDDCEIFNAGQTEKGILVTGPDATVIVQDNDASIHGFAIGIDVNGGNATITNNHIYDNGIGVRFINGGNGDANTNKFYEAGMPNGKDIEVASDAGAVTATPDNWFAGSSFGVDNLSSLTVDATQCYWNDPTGPGPIGPGSGANVSANVLWCPWLGDIPTAFGGTGLPLSSPTVSIVVSETSGLTNDDGTICDGDAVLLDATSPGAVSYLWSTTDVTPSINVSPSTTTIYTVTVTFAGCIDDESVTITVDPLPVLSGPTEVCVGSTIQMLPSSGGTWTSSNDLIATITNGGVVTGESAGSATFTFTNSATGCSNTTASVTVNPVPDATITAPEFAWENTAGYIASVPNAGGGATYAWSVSSGSFSGTTESITITTGAAGTLTVNVTVTHANGCVSMGTAFIEVLPACLMIDFSDPVLLSNTQALGYWYTDRYNPNAFEGQTTAPDATPNTLHVGIDASDGQGSGFYNTQGRKFDLYAGTQAIQADLYIPADWATTNRRMAGLWGTGVDVGSAISAYPIIEFSSDASTPRFRVWESGTGTWVDLGLPVGFIYNNWVTLRIQLLASGEFLYTVLSQQGDLQFTTTTSAPDATVEIINTILQGHNTTAGVTYDIYWDNFKSSTILTPTITAPAEVCAGTTGNVASVTPVGGATYNWTVDGGVLTNGQGTTAIEFAAGVGSELTLSVTIDDGDCEVTTSAIVLINPLPSAVITTAPTVVESTPNNPATIPDAGGGATYVWAITNGTITNGQGTSSILYTAGSPGVLTLDVTVTDANGCISTGTINVNVIAAGASSMQWVPDDGAHGSCGASTDCCADIICFGLEYTPGVSGNLTTYTTGFITNCLGGFPSGITPINSNMSCVMTDNSFEIDGCAMIDSVLFNSSGNAGSVPVLAGNPIILHKVCFNLSAGDVVGVKEDVITNLSASVDLTGGGQYTEFPTYTTTTLSKTLPVIPPNGASTVNCPADATMPVPPLVLDYCGNTVPATWDSTVDSPDPVTCEGTRTYNFTYTDCANEEYPWSYTYTIEYTSGINAPTNTSETVSCPAEAVNPGPPAIITDACGRTVSPGLIGSDETPDPVTCNGTVIWTYRYTACDGSIADWTHTYTVTYTGGLTAPSDEAETISCPADAVDPGPPAIIYDACGRTVVPDLIGSAEVPDPVICNGTIIWTYRYTACDDSFVDWTKTYTIDYSGGLTAPANVSETISCDVDAVDPGPPSSILDACGRTVVPGLIGSLESPNPVICNGTIIWTYRYTACDAETFVDWTKTYIIDYSEGLTAPANTMSVIECPADALDPGPPADITDACGRTVSPGLIGSSAPPACEGSIVWTYRYTACDGTTTIDWTHTYQIIRTTLPSESGGPVEISSIIECPDDALPPDLPVILDVCGTTLSPDGPPVIGGTNTGGCSGTITYTYSYTDCALNQFEWVYTYTVECNALNLKVFLQGPYNASGDTMKNELNINHVLPGQDKLLSPNPGIQFGAPFTPFGQPYNVAPWNYNGNTGMNFGDPSAPGAPGGVIPYPPDVVDWVLITIRKNGILPANNHWSCAGWVHTDGTISFPEDCGPIGVDPMDDHYILVQHRNHLGVLSPMPIEEYCGGITMEWDFTISNSYQPIFRYGQAEVEPGVWAMLKANGEQISSINAISSPDRTTWRILQNALGYGIGDYNMNAATTSGDETDWKINQNKTSGIIFY